MDSLLIPLERGEKLVRTDDFLIEDGLKATVIVTEGERTIRDPEGVSLCISKMLETAANVLVKSR